MDGDLLEKLSEICHDEWIDWTKNISKELMEMLEILDKDIEYFNEQGIENKEAIELRDKLNARLERWQSLWIPYDNLSEDYKEADRIYARKMLDCVNDYK